MGRIKTKLIKRVTNKLVREHEDKFKDKFDDNKKVVTELTDAGKKIRNIISGYVTRLIKAKKEKS